MTYLIANLMNCVAFGLSCIAVGYLVGNIRGRKKTREQLMSKAPYLIYNHDS